MKPRGSKDNRPVNLDISTIKLPVTAYASISHRVTGVLLFVSSVLLVWALDAVSPRKRAQSVGHATRRARAKAALWAFLVIFSYHALAGIRHLIMDMGIGEISKAVRLGARILFAASALAAVAWGIVLW